MTVRPIRPSVIAVVAMLIVSSCGGDDRTCTLMAWYSGVDVGVESNAWHVQEFVSIATAMIRTQSSLKLRALTGIACF